MRSIHGIIGRQITKCTVIYGVYIQCMYTVMANPIYIHVHGIIGREITKYLVIYGVFIQCMYTVVANPIYIHGNIAGTSLYKRSWPTLSILNHVQGTLAHNHAHKCAPAIHNHKHTHTNAYLQHTYTHKNTYMSTHTYIHTRMHTYRHTLDNKQTRTLSHSGVYAWACPLPRRCAAAPHSAPPSLWRAARAGAAAASAREGAPAAGVVVGIYSGSSFEKTECWYCSRPAAANARERSSCSRCGCWYLFRFVCWENWMLVLL